MATVKPFKALRPDPKLAGSICELPYDVMSSEEARLLAAGNDLSFLHVSKPEIDLPAGVDLYSPAVYEKGRENFQRLIQRQALRQDAEARFYFYRQIMGDHSQIGLVGAVSCQEYLKGVIKKHELTRPDKEDDRVRHIETLNAQTGPAFLIYPSDSAINDIATRSTSTPPDIDFVAPDGVRHSSWTVRNALDAQRVETLFQSKPALYIADGHHRTAAAGRVFQARQGAGQSGHFLAVIFPEDQVKILPYNRVLKDLNGRTPDQLLAELNQVFTIEKPGPSSPAGKHEVSLFLRNQWHLLRFRPELIAPDDPLEQLDANLLQKLVLRPLFGIDNPRTSQRISFVGGIRGASELERLVSSGEFACAFAMFPTSVEDLMTIADRGGIMPPKSTWFEPKLRDGLFSYLLES